MFLDSRCRRYTKKDVEYFGRADASFFVVAIVPVEEHLVPFGINRHLVGRVVCLSLFRKVTCVAVFYRRLEDCLESNLNILGAASGGHADIHHEVLQLVISILSIAIV